MSWLVASQVDLGFLKQPAINTDLSLMAVNQTIFLILISEYLQ
jgi:hypothetical protein